ncbi:hypothetical protein BC828DRAFT_379007 [Blastocladiella britannica]|nr:hypothetical protein BC828DRAFT_379007 [Blastocladiella britannica]
MRYCYSFALAIVLFLSVLAARPAHAETFEGSKNCTESSSCAALATCQLGTCVLNTCLPISSVSSCGKFNGTTYCKNGRCVPRTVPLGGKCSGDFMETFYNDPCLPNLKCDWFSGGVCNDPANPVDFSSKPMNSTLVLISCCVSIAFSVLSCIFAFYSYKKRSQLNAIAK